LNRRGQEFGVLKTSGVPRFHGTNLVPPRFLRAGFVSSYTTLPNGWSPHARLDRYEATDNRNNPLSVKLQKPWRKCDVKESC